MPTVHTMAATRENVVCQALLSEAAPGAWKAASPKSPHRTVTSSGDASTPLVWRPLGERPRLNRYGHIVPFLGFF